MEGHVGQEQEDGSIDIHHAHLGQLLSQKYQTNQDGHHLERIHIINLRPFGYFKYILLASLKFIQFIKPKTMVITIKLRRFQNDFDIFKFHCRYLFLFIFASFFNFFN